MKICECESLADRTLREFFGQIDRDVCKIAPWLPLDRVLSIFLKNDTLRHVYVVNEHGIYLGRIRFAALAEKLFPYEMMSRHGMPFQAAQLSSLTISIAADLVGHDPCSLKDTDTLRDLARLVEETGEETAPVVDLNRRFVGEANLYRILRERLSCGGNVPGRVAS